MRCAQSVEDVRVIARRRLPRAVFDFVEGGAEDEITLARNRERLSQISLVPRALVDVSHRDQSTSLLGTTVASPVVLAPVGLAALAHPDGERGAARAASGLGLLSTLSSSSCWSLEDVAASCDGPKWFQIYVLRDRGLTRALIDRARAASYRALCLTVDVPVAGRRDGYFPTGSPSRRGLRPGRRSTCSRTRGSSGGCCATNCRGTGSGWEISIRDTHRAPEAAWS